MTPAFETPVSVNDHTHVILALSIELFQLFDCYMRQWMSPVSVDLVQVSGLLVCHEFTRYLGLVYTHFLSTEQLLYVTNDKVRSKYSKPFETRNVSFVYLEYSLYFGVGKAILRYYFDSLQTVKYTSQ